VIPKEYDCRKTKIIKYVMNGKSEASLICEHGIPEVTRHSWMNGECKSHLFVYSIEDDEGRRLDFVKSVM
jgi:hypothetical protein